MRHRTSPLSALLSVAIAVATVCAPLASPVSAADPAQAPVAVRWWGQGFVTIETWWGLRVAIDPYDPERTGYADPGVRANLVLVTHGHADHDHPEIVRGGPFIVRGLAENGAFRELDLTLDRLPNDTAVKLTKTSERGLLGPHPVRVTSIPSWHDDAQGEQRGANAMFLIEVDGVRILHCGDLGQSELTTEQLAEIGPIDAMLLPVGGTYTIDGKTAARIASQVAPRYVVPIHFKTPDGRIELDTAASFLAALDENVGRREAVGNTLAVASATESSAPGLTAVVLRHRPWEAPEHIREGLARIREARSSLAATVASLTVEQLDHKPSNGTHTVRWNAEHTAGSELIFMSLVFRHSNEALPIIRVTPAQQPADYSPAHPDWTAAEEAAHMRRTGEFAERFAYLFDGIDPDEERYPAFFKSLNGLFDLMHNHYNRHHEQVKKKFELADWPKN